MSEIIDGKTTFCGNVNILLIFFIIIFLAVSSFVCVWHLAFSWSRSYVEVTDLLCQTDMVWQKICFVFIMHDMFLLFSLCSAWSLVWQSVFHYARYWQLDISKVPAPNSKEVWDRSVYEASEEYKGRMVSFVAEKCLYYQLGAKFTKHLRTILGQFHDILHTYANVLIHKTFYDNFTTKILRNFLGVLWHFNLYTIPTSSNKKNFFVSIYKTFNSIMLVI